MAYKQYKIKKETDDLFELVKAEYLRHHPEMIGIPISKNKMVYEGWRVYLEVK